MNQRRKVTAVVVGCAGIVMALQIGEAGVDCDGINHPNGCAHKTISGTEACDTGSKSCAGADEINCATTTGKFVEAFPKEVEDSTVPGGPGGTLQCWSGHHYITTDPNHNCSYTFTCRWVTGSCVERDGSHSGWTNASWKTSNGCTIGGG
jgi:hypothetical protein